MRRATDAACVAAALVITVLDVHGSPVTSHSTDPADLGPGVGVRLLAAVAGLALAALRPVGHLATMRLMPTPRVR